MAKRPATPSAGVRAGRAVLDVVAWAALAMAAYTQSQNWLDALGLRVSLTVLTVVGTMLAIDFAARAGAALRPPPRDDETREMVARHGSVVGNLLLALVFGVPAVAMMLYSSAIMLIGGLRLLSGHLASLIPALLFAAYCVWAARNRYVCSSQGQVG